MKRVLYLCPYSDRSKAQKLLDCLSGKLQNSAVVRNIADILADEHDLGWEIRRSDCVVLIASRLASSLIKDKKQEIEDDCITFDGKVIHDEFTGNKEIMNKLILVFFMERTENDWVPNGLDQRRIFNLQGEKIHGCNPVLDHLEYTIRRALGETMVDCEGNKAQKLLDCLAGKLRNTAEVRNILDILAEKQDFTWAVRNSDCVVLIRSRLASSLIQNEKQEIEDYWVTFDGKVIHDEFTRNKELLDKLITVFFTKRNKNDWIPDGLDQKRIFDLHNEKIHKGNPAVTYLEYKRSAWRDNGGLVAVFEGHKSNIHFVLSFGSNLISVDEESTVRIWVIETTELYLEMKFNAENFHITCLMHPSTYLNKIILCSKQGQMQLWNIKTNKLIYTFSGWSEPITAVEQAPAVDVVGVGLQSGKIFLHNLKFDETVMSFHQEWGPVIGLTFRTDGNPVMASASTEGHIALWDLEKRRLSSTLRDAHTGSVCGIRFLSSQPLLATSGPDNSLKIWIFDQLDGSGRLLRSRSSHSAPPTKIRFYGNNGFNILSAGLDRSLRFISVIKDERSCEFSQGSLTKKSKNRGVHVEDLKLAPVVDFSSEISRESAWDNIVTCHQGHKEARTWSFQRKCIGKHHLKSRAGENAGPIMTTAKSSCGNFAIIGDAHGYVNMFNVQSGIHRGSLGEPKAHNGQVRGVAIDNINQQVMTAGADCKLKFWNFKARNLLQKMTFESPITQILLHRDSSLLAVAFEDFEIHVVDVDMKRVVRIFQGHTNRITDMSFSPDCRWLITSAMDSSVRTWSLPAARLIDCFLVESPVTSLAMSPIADFLVTTHVDDLGVYLWCNKTLYDEVSLVPLPADYQPTLEQLPCTGTDADKEFGDLKETTTKGEGDASSAADTTAGYKSPDQLSDELVTLSLLPKSRWRHLTSLELIKKRNKPREPPKAPKAAPFFLPTTQELVPKFLQTEEDQTDEKDANSKILDMKQLEQDSEFQKLLKEGSSSGNYELFLVHLKSMGPSSIDAETRSLGPSAGGDVKLVEAFMLFLEHQLQSRRDFEFTEGIMGLFLKLHGPLIAEQPELGEVTTRLLEEHKAAWSTIRDLLNQCSCLVNYLKSAVI
ncbi:WD repeat-containing protein 36-like [Stylophora pistillata]|uniref:WD repeat-containing protein 36-like n=1 Tax=Stylophora pistillata TaxID=50429 RepID=UPI000C03B8F0|nr:WD repeat-containing protein 36-like [Stylophora pistillata]